MADIKRLWRIYPQNSALKQRLSEALGVSPALAQVLINRGLTDKDEARAFLQGGQECLLDPWLLKDMAKAVSKIEQAIAKGKQITIYGDYDVDGVTASALLYMFLQRLGAQVNYYIPERQSEGYGLNFQALESLLRSGTGLLITVDCGISAIEEIDYFRQKMDIIITDHHQPPPQLPPAYAILNPKQPGCAYPNKELAGVGVAFKLCQALWNKRHPGRAPFTEYMDLVAVGTIADIVPLLGENRIIAKLGLAQLENTSNIGLKALLQVSGLEKRKLSAGHIGFVLAPRLNAAGRISHAITGVELLTTADPQRALKLAEVLNQENQERQAVEREILMAAEQIITARQMENAKVLVLAGENWHPGVIGIVASRLVEKYYRPVVMISIRDGIGKGSCRSIPKFDMYQALSHCRDLLLQFGGHHQAAGLSILPENIPLLEQRLAAYADVTLTPEDYCPVLNIDAVVAMQEIDMAFLEQLASLEPHGVGNPEPVFLCQDLVLTGIRPVGSQGQHLKLRVKSHDRVSDVIGWNMGDYIDRLHCNCHIDLAFKPDINEWGGLQTIQLTAQDLRETFPVSSGMPDREMLARLYLTLKRLIAPEKSIEITHTQLCDYLRRWFQVTVAAGTVRLALKILAELGLITLSGGENGITIRLNRQPEKKLDLNCSPTYVAIMQKTCWQQEE